MVFPKDCDLTHQTPFQKEDGDKCSSERGQCLEAARAAWNIHDLQKLIWTQFPQELWDGGVGICHIWGFFPLGENIQPSRGVLERPKTFSIYMVFFRVDTVKSQEGPGVLDLHNQSEEMWIKCLVRAKKKVFLKINPSLCQSW